MHLRICILICVLSFNYVQAHGNEPSLGFSVTLCLTITVDCQIIDHIKLMDGCDTMKYFFTAFCSLVSLLRVLAQCDVPASGFHMDGDYLLGGLFDIHHANTAHHQRPETIDCSR